MQGGASLSDKWSECELKCPHRTRVWVEIFGAGRVRVRVASSATGTGRVAEMVNPHTPTRDPTLIFGPPRCTVNHRPPVSLCLDSNED